MTYLLNTNTLLWAGSSQGRLSRRARRICESPGIERAVSAVSLWEVIAKCTTGKLSIADVANILPVFVSNLSARVLPLEASHAYAAYSLPLLHKDPFDRMLIAQAAAEGLTLMAKDAVLHRYAVKVLW